MAGLLRSATGNQYAKPTISANCSAVITPLRTAMPLITQSPAVERGFTFLIT